MAKFNRILLKLSGESLMGEKKYGIDENRLAEYAAQKGMAPHLHARRIFPPMRPESAYHAVIPTRISSTDNLME